MATYVFKETQKFNQPWIWGLLTSAFAYIFLGIFSYEEVSLQTLLPIIIVSLIIVVFASMRLKTRIDESGLTFSFFPFIGDRKYNLKDIQKLELIEYNSIFKFGGWGIRYNFFMWAYNVRGKHGLVVHLKDKKFLLGTQKPEEIKKAIEQFSLLKGGDHAS